MSTPETLLAEADKFRKAAALAMQDGEAENAVLFLRIAARSEVARGLARLNSYVELAAGVPLALPPARCATVADDNAGLILDTGTALNTLMDILERRL